MAVEVAAKKRQFCVYTHNNKNIEREWLTLSAFLTTVFQQTGAISKMSDKTCAEDTDLTQFEVNLWRPKILLE